MQLTILRLRNGHPTWQTKIQQLQWLLWSNSDGWLTVSRGLSLQSQSSPNWKGMIQHGNYQWWLLIGIVFKHISWIQGNRTNWVPNGSKYYSLLWLRISFGRSLQYQWPLKRHALWTVMLIPETSWDLIMHTPSQQWWRLGRQRPIPSQYSLLTPLHSQVLISTSMNVYATILCIYYTYILYL